MSDFNERIIEEFRANGGKVGGPFEGANMILLHHRGAATGAERVAPLVYQDAGPDRWVIFASYGGAPKDPQWFRNLVADPETTVEVGTETIPVRARVAEGAERDELWSKQKAAVPQFAEYEERTDRAIPVVILERR